MEIFPNPAASLRLAAAVVIEAHDEWRVTRRYLSEVSMAELGKVIAAKQAASQPPAAQPQIAERSIQHGSLISLVIKFGLLRPFPRALLSEARRAWKECPMSRPEPTNSVASKTASAKSALARKVAVRAATASTRLEDRSVPAGHVRSRGVKVLLAELQARKR